MLDDNRLKESVSILTQNKMDEKKTAILAVKTATLTQWLMLYIYNNLSYIPIIISPFLSFFLITHYHSFFYIFGEYCSILKTVKNILQSYLEVKNIVSITLYYYSFILLCL